MKIIIYPGSEYNTDHFRDFSNINLINFVQDTDLIGVRLTLEADFDFKEELTKSVSKYITENYLENYILCKIYDEYPCIDIIETTDIINDFTSDFSRNFMSHILSDLIIKSEKINLPSLVLFNIKPIMLTTNSIVDKLCNSIVLNKKYDMVSQLINSYNELLNREYFENNGREPVTGINSEEHNSELMVDINQKE